MCHKGAGPTGPLDEWAVLVIDGHGGAVRGKVMPHHVNIRLFASHAYCSDSRKKCTLSTLDMAILLFCRLNLKVGADSTMTLIQIAFSWQQKRTENRGIQSLLHSDLIPQEVEVNTPTLYLSIILSHHINPFLSTLTVHLTLLKTDYIKVYSKTGFHFQHCQEHTHLVAINSLAN